MGASPARTRDWAKRSALVALSLVAASVALLGAAPRADGSQALTAWQYSDLAPYGPGTRLMVPRDGRIAGYGFSSVITGVAFTGHAGGGDQAVVAAPGDQLVVISLTEHDDDQSDIYGYNAQVAPAYALMSGTHRVPLPSPETAALSPYSTTWAVSVPKGSPAVLSVSRAGFTQSFDLRAGKRLGTSPLALYRGGNSPEVDVSLSASQTLTATGGPGGPVSFTVAPQQASLVYFKPGSAVSPAPPPDKGWLLVDMTVNSGATDAQGNSVSLGGYIAGKSALLKVGKGTVEPLTLSTFGGTSPFPDYYAYEVPANLRDATMAISLNGRVPATDGGNKLELDFHDQVADVQISFPPLPRPRGTGYLPAGQATSHNAPKRSAASSPTHNSSGGSLPVGFFVALAAVLVLAAGAVLLLPRRRLFVLPVVPVGRSPASLLAGLPPLPAGPEKGSDGELLGLPAAPISTIGTGTATVEEAAGASGASAGAPPGSARPAVVVRLLGPVDVGGLRAPIRRRDVRRLLVALALCTDGPVSVERLRDLVSKDPDRSQSTEGVHQLASRLRASLPEGALPQIGAGDLGYRLSSEVEVDWSVFQALASRAGLAEGAARVGLGLKALSLVRGVPLAHESWEGVAELVRSVETAIENLAADTARAALALRDARSAEAAIKRGLDAVNGSPVLWELRLVAAAAGSGFGLERAWGECRKTLKADASVVEPTYRRLRQGEF